MHSNYVELAEDAGYHFGDTVHIMRMERKWLYEMPVKNNFAFEYQVS